jgi:serine/threonine-protein kinase SRPK3
MEENYTSSIEYSTTECTTETAANIDLTNDIINNYNVISQLGKGSYSRVWLVYSMNDNNYYALKVQNYDDYDEGVEEINILKKIPNDAKNINQLKEFFIETRMIDNKKRKFICSVYDLCCGNLDGLARKGKYKNGYPENMVKNMFKQILNSLYTVHYKMNGFHGDIKPDNILLCGINNRDKAYIDMYNKINFISLYNKTKNDYCQQKNISVKKLDTDKKHEIRKKIHEAIMKSFDINNDNQYLCDDKYFENPHIKLTDFGFFCHNSEKFNDSFGTRYYMAPEIILMGDCTSKVDIWALGCMLYELLTGEILFDPNSGSRGSTDFYHLEMMINLCGQFYKNFLSSTKRYKKFFKDGKLINIKYEPINIKKKLENHNINNPILINLIESMLQLYPKHRPNIKELLEHEWFSSN